MMNFELIMMDFEGLYGAARADAKGIKTDEMCI